MLLNHVMSWPERSLQGFALAATVADDPEAALASPGLAPEIAGHVTKIARELALLDSGARRQRIRGLVRMLSEPLDPASPLTPRARALLARAVPREVGRSWLADAPAPRPGFQPEPALIALVRRIAARRAPRPDRSDTGKSGG